MDTLRYFQFNLLPFGSPLLLAVLAVLWLRRGQLQRGDSARVLAFGAVGAGVLVAVFFGLRALPWAMPCLDCLASNEWYSVCLTFLQWWGIGSAAVLAWRFARPARRNTSEQSLS